MKALTISIAAVAALLSAPAAAQPTAIEDESSVDVPYADLNLGNPAGAKILERRVAAKSRVTCGNRRGHDVMNQWEKIDNCQQRFINSAKEQIAMARASAN